VRLCKKEKKSSHKETKFFMGRKYGFGSGSLCIPLQGRSSPFSRIAYTTSILRRSFLRGKEGIRSRLQGGFKKG